MAEESTKPVGRPPKFSTVDELERAVNEYFSDLNNRPFTITGIALWLGFCDRQSLYDYQEKPEFTCMIKELRLRVEHEYEQQLYTKIPTGAIFALKNMGWSDKTQQEISGPNGGPVNLIFQPAPGCDPIKDESGNTTPE